MPSDKSARVGERRRVINMLPRSRAKSLVVKARKLVESGDLDIAETAVRDAVVALDKAAQKGAIPRNNASRRKSRIMKRLESARKD